MNHCRRRKKPGLRSTKLRYEIDQGVDLLIANARGRQNPDLADRCSDTHMNHCRRRKKPGLRSTKLRYATVNRLDKQAISNITRRDERDRWWLPVLPHLRGWSLPSYRRTDLTKGPLSRNTPFRFTQRSQALSSRLALRSDRIYRI